jgi:hypothetical protein
MKLYASPNMTVFLMILVALCCQSPLVASSKLRGASRRRSAAAAAAADILEVDFDDEHRNLQNVTGINEGSNGAVVGSIVITSGNGTVTETTETSTVVSNAELAENEIEADDNVSTVNRMYIRTVIVFGCWVCKMLTIRMSAAFP